MAHKPTGRPTRSRDQLRNNFIVALSEDFSAHGAGAIKEMREKDPSGYVRAIASLMPKEMDIKHQVNPLEHLSDEQIQQLVDATDSFLAERAGEVAAQDSGGAESPEVVSPLH